RLHMSFASWLRGNKAPQGRRPIRHRVYRPWLEVLEDRLAPAVVNWDGGGGDFNWNNALNWDTNTLPTAADDVVIDVAAALTVTHPSGTTSINKLTSQESLTLSGGTFTIAASSSIAGAFTLSGGTLTGAGNLEVLGLTKWTSGTMSGLGSTDAKGG